MLSSGREHLRCVVRIRVSDSIDFARELNSDEEVAVADVVHDSSAHRARVAQHGRTVGVLVSADPDYPIPGDDGVAEDLDVGRLLVHDSRCIHWIGSSDREEHHGRWCRRA